MILSDLSVRRPVFAAVLSLLLVLAGAIAYTRLPVRDLPAVEPPVIAVDVTYRGANAQVVENRITQILEDRISGIEGIESIVSRSRDGRADITIEFSATRDLDAAANDVRDRIAGALRSLPVDADPPEVGKVDVDAQPILWMNLIHPGWTPMQLTDYAERVLVDRFSAIQGVSRVQVGGEARPAVRIWLSRTKLAAHGLTPADVEEALRRQNVELPAGRLEGDTTNLTVRLERPFATAEAFARLVIRQGPDGYLLRIGDVARVTFEPENRYSFFRSNGERAIGLGIVRQSGANTLQVARDVKAEMDEVRPLLPPGMELAVSFDSSLFIDRAIRNVWWTLAEAALLVVAVIFVFLGSLRATLIPAVTVPICLIATFAVLWALGYSLNLLTLLAFVLAIGLVVDDAIVVLENIHHRIEAGEPPLAAAFTGARQVGFAVVASTVVVCAVFVPLYFIAGNVGLLFRELAGAMIGAIAFSGFVALSLTPMLCSKLLRAEAGRNAFNRAFDRRFDQLRAAYRRALSRVVDRPVMVGGVALVLVGGCLWLARDLPAELAPEEDTGAFFVTVLAAEGTGFATMAGYMEDLQDRILPLVEAGRIRRLLARAPAAFGPTEDFATGGMTVFLHPWEQRDFTTRDVVTEVQRLLAQDPRVRAFATVGSTLSRGRGAPIQFVIAGASFEELARVRDALMAAAERSGLILDLDSDYRETRPQLVVDIDTTRAGALGVPVAEIGATLETMMGSRRVTTFIDRGEEYNVVLQAEDSDRASPEDLDNVHVRSATSGALVPLANLVQVRERAAAGELGRFNKLRAITLQGNLAPGATLGQALDFLEAEARKYPEVAAIGYRGESLALRQTGSSLVLILGFTVLLVFLVLAAQFESFVHPFVILLTVPLAVGGGLLGLVAMGGTLNIYSQIGIVILVGLAAKNGILIVEFANQLRDAGLAFREAILEAAGRRLRPVLMTSIATVAGAMPLMLASGAGAGSRQAIGVVIVWGVSLATLLTLFVVPVAYAWMARRTRSPQSIARELEAELKARAAQPAE
ncbi:MAG: efflux RND transporter permease subunit [Sphingomonadaceae bacterium]|uniref:efflux RND transporter permease subunit n=1 Tax=Thermaurantiacus sp. TaxID=2820283 RepID=UPI00298F3907|nr:efflux RND transporter permease subunit [Thermaurantiacus sp.]MCS6986143.1 efflux RND transporter permease subunit [Sphingomonadaceae bacterium]MDW8414631.1 efflux RND transporter permease subunit [Thermaurantiacus sp.]